MIESLIANAEHTAKVERPTDAESTIGGRRVTWTTIYETLPCYVQPKDAELDVALERRQSSMRAMLYFEGAYTMVVGDKVTWQGLTGTVMSVTDMAGRGVVSKAVIGP